MPIPWNDDPPGSESTIQANLKAILDSIAADAPNRMTPTSDLAKEWHRRMFAGVTLPVPYYAGNFRDSDPTQPHLTTYRVRVGSALGVEPGDVLGHLAALEASLHSSISRLDALLPVGAQPSKPAELEAVLRVAAFAHGEWVRIHPFANCNGRTARVWANWVVRRYDLPLFVRLRPRPGNVVYAAGAIASMGGDHDPMFNALLTLLREHLATNP